METLLRLDARRDMTISNLRLLLFFVGVSDARQVVVPCASQVVHHV
jgi:hypothetical protein